MCNICENKEKLKTDFKCVEVVVNGNLLDISYDAYSTDSSFTTEIKINYCPICGNKLKNYESNN